MLRLDFYESGVGETIVVTFPSGGVGIVDAHPSPGQNRPCLTEIIRDRQIHFVCLTHPHADHGADLTKVFDCSKVNEFWHTVDDVAQFIFCLEQNPTFISPFKEFARLMREGWAKFLIDLFHQVIANRVSIKTLRDDLVETTIDGVTIYSLSPSERMKVRWFEAYKQRASGSTKDLPSANLLSAVIALRYGESVVLLGSDALKANWRTIIPRYRYWNLQKCAVLKVPHHGASNSFLFNPKRHEANYLSLVRADHSSLSVLFAGDIDHPDKEVLEHLRRRTVVCSFHDDAKTTGPIDPLGLMQHPGFKAIAEKVPTHHTISIGLSIDGTFEYQCESIGAVNSVLGDGSRLGVTSDE